MGRPVGGGGAALREAAQFAVAGGEVGADGVAVLRGGGFEQQGAPYGQFPVGDAPHEHGGGVRGLGEVGRDLVDEAEFEGPVGAEGVAPQHDLPGAGPTELPGQAVDGQAGPEVPVVDGEQQPQVGGGDAEVGGQQQVEGGAAAGPGGHGEGEGALAFEAVDGLLPAAHGPYVDLAGPGAGVVGGGEQPQQQDEAFGAGRLQQVAGGVEGGGQLRQGPGAVDVEGEGESVRGAARRAVGPHGQVFLPSCHQRARAISIVDPGPIVMRTPWSPGRVRSSAASRW